jgi:hypothetical protein
VSSWSTKLRCASKDHSAWWPASAPARADEHQGVPVVSSKDEAELRINKARILETGLRSAKGSAAAPSSINFANTRSTTTFVGRLGGDGACRPSDRAHLPRREESNGHQPARQRSGDGGTVDGVARIEHAMDAVMTLTTVATRLGDRCGLTAPSIKTCGPSCLRRTRAVSSAGWSKRCSTSNRLRGERLSRRVQRDDGAVSSPRDARHFTDLVEQAVGESLAARR